MTIPLILGEQFHQDYYKFPEAPAPFHHLSQLDMMC